MKGELCYNIFSQNKEFIKIKQQKMKSRRPKLSVLNLCCKTIYEEDI